MRDSKGIYTKRFDDDGNPVLDENGNQIRDYITDEYDASVKEMFDFIKNKILNFLHIQKQITCAMYLTAMEAKSSQQTSRSMYIR